MTAAADWDRQITAPHPTAEAAALVAAIDAERDDIAWPPLGIPSDTAHKWKGNGYHCGTCWASYHCPQCSDKAGGQGHYLEDNDGPFFSCQERERAEAWRTAFFARFRGGMS